MHAFYVRVYMCIYSIPYSQTCIIYTSLCIHNVLMYYIIYVHVYNVHTHIMCEELFCPIPMFRCGM